MTAVSVLPPAARVLSVSAHPDDSEFFAGGTLARFGAAGADVTLVVCTDGSFGGREDTFDPEAIKATRRREQGVAAEALGVSRVVVLDQVDGSLVADDPLRAALVGEIRRYRPDIVLGHHPQTFYQRFGDLVQPGHSDHRAAGTALMDALYPRSGSPNFYPDAGEPWLPREAWLFDCAEPDFLLDITAGFGAKITALEAHGSQQGAGGGLIRAAHRAGAMFGSTDAPAEAFVRLQLRRDGAVG